jgi:release factor glutamine methyltransferase
MTVLVETAIPLAQKAAAVLAERGIENARLEAELLLAHVLGIKRLDLYLQYDRPLTEQQLEQFRGFIRRRMKREPLQYIVGSVQFRNLELQVDHRVLIPRPETELLVEEVVRFARERGDEQLSAIDIGTGSGAIALSMAHECPNVSVIATDLVAASANGVEIRTGSVWQAVEPQERFDIVVSNPPYIAESERDSLQPEVRDWEPAAALFAGPDGLDVIRAIVSGAPAHMNQGGLLAIEIGMTQAAAVTALIEATCSFENIRVVRDLSSRDRIVTAVCRKQNA